jgi:hypothetical protein
MNHRRTLSATLAFSFALAIPAHGAGWSAAEERHMAADAASFAPPDLKKQLAKNGRRLMEGVSECVSAETSKRDAAAHRAAAARGARELAESIRRHTPFDEIAYQTAGIVHELAMALPPSAATESASPGARFLGFSAAPFAAPETLVAAPLPSATPRDRYDAAVTLTARLLAWIWKTAGGDASLVTQYPAAKGPYPIRE